MNKILKTTSKVLNILASSWSYYYRKFHLKLIRFYPYFYPKQFILCIKFGNPIELCVFIDTLHCNLYTRNVVLLSRSRLYAIGLLSRRKFNVVFSHTYKLSMSFVDIE